MPPTKPLPRPSMSLLSAVPGAAAGRRLAMGRAAGTK